MGVGKEPAPSIPKVRDPDAAARRKRTVPHRRNPLAAESRREKEAAEAAEDAKVRMTDLPEAGLVRLVNFEDSKGTYVRATVHRQGDISRSLRSLEMSGIPFHVRRLSGILFHSQTLSGDEKYAISVVLRVDDVYRALPAIDALGYVVQEVSSVPLAVVAK